MNIITISREFGSGGRELGKRLADELGFSYFDTEIVSGIAEKSKLDEGYVDYVLENGVMNQIPITFSHSFSFLPYLSFGAADIFAEQRNIIRELAAGDNCIIVGRNADVFLEKEKPLRIFVYADMQSKIKRCMDRAPEGEKLTAKEMERKIKQVDKARANSHSIIADVAWGDKRGYDICVNTSNTVIKDIIPAVAQFARAWLSSK